MPRLLVAGKIHSSGETLLDRLRSEGVHVDYVPDMTVEGFLPFIGEADALVIRTQPVSASTVSAARALKVVSRHGVGYDSVDVAALNARGIALTIVGDVNSISVAEHAMMQLLAGAKQALRADRAVRESGRWEWRNQLQQREISGKNLLIIGYGRAGRQLARMAAGFRMAVRAHDPFLETAGWPDGDVPSAPDLHAALGWADFVSIHIPKGDRPLLAAEEFAAMKPGLILANTARGGIVCEEALTAALQDGTVHFAGLDVFADEPPLPAIPLAGLDNALLSPHIAGLTEEASERMAIASIENALGFLKGTIAPELIVNKEAVRA